MKTALLLTCCLVMTLGAQPCFAQQSEEELAKAVQNPIANLISLPLQNNTNFNIGPDNRTQNVLNIQPVWPFSRGDWNIITRTIAPIITQPDLASSSGSTSGLGDINMTAFLSPAKSQEVTWGVGPILSFPTATDDALGSKKWWAGPSAVFLIQPSPWVVGVLANNLWSFAGDDERGDVNAFLLQYFVNYNLRDGWYLLSAPILTANWKADDGQQWTIPFGGGLGRVFRVGKQPINAQVSGYWNAEKPDLGPDWQLRAQVQFLFPK